MPSMLPISRSVLVELFARASSAARIVDDLDGRAGSNAVERLAGHIEAIVHELGELIGAYHLTVEPLPSDEAPTQSTVTLPPVDELRQLMARADALATVTDEQFCRIVVLTDGDDRRGFRRLAHLVELTASAVTAASDASDRLIAAVEHTLPAERT